jgi:ADP-ribose pyrophosphatase YjhB (NUDIX family)
VEFCGGSDQEHYIFPGGGVEVGETLEAGVRREVLEEACLEVHVQRLLLSVESIGSSNTNFIGGRHVPWNELRFFFLSVPPMPRMRRGCLTARTRTRPGFRWMPLDSLVSTELLPRISRELLGGLGEEPECPIIIANPGQA